ncbi:MAG: VWA domain-containing protein [Bacteroidales bacterium]
MWYDLSFANPRYFYLLLLLPLLIFWYFKKYRKSVPHLHFSDSEFKASIHKTLRQRLHPLWFILRLLCICAIIVALARPQSNLRSNEENVEGIDIIMAMDVSGSMLAEDFRPNRLEAAKKVAADFMKGRSTDRMGIVAFSGEAYTQCPLTIDHAILNSQLRALRSGLIADGTALGDGLAVAVNRLRNSEAISKTIILLTDGVNNMGAIDPLSAADMAQLYGIRVYTVGVGTRGLAPYPFQTPFGIQYQNVEVQIDEDLLSNIASSTGGKYFRATNQNKLKAIFKEIDRLEKTKIEVLSFEHKADEYKIWVWIALAFLSLEIIFRLFVFKTIP